YLIQYISVCNYQAITFISELHLTGITVWRNCCEITIRLIKSPFLCLKYDPLIGYVQDSPVLHQFCMFNGFSLTGTPPCPFKQSRTAVPIMAILLHRLFFQIDRFVNKVNLFTTFQE